MSLEGITATWICKQCRNFRAACFFFVIISPSSSECCLWNSLGHFVNFIALNMCQKTCTYITTSYFCISSISYWSDCCVAGGRVEDSRSEQLINLSTFDEALVGKSYRQSRNLQLRRDYEKNSRSKEIRTNIINQIAARKRNILSWRNLPLAFQPFSLENVFTNYCKPEELLESSFLQLINKWTLYITKARLEIPLLILTFFQCRTQFVIFPPFVCINSPNPRNLP